VIAFVPARTLLFCRAFGYDSATLLKRIFREAEIALEFCLCPLTRRVACRMFRVSGPCTSGVAGIAVKRPRAKEIQKPPVPNRKGGLTRSYWRREKQKVHRRQLPLETLLEKITHVAARNI